MNKHHPSQLKARPKSGLKSKSILLPVGDETHVVVSVYALNAVWRFWKNTKEAFGERTAGELAQCLREVRGVANVSDLTATAQASALEDWFARYELAVSKFAVEARESDKPKPVAKPAGVVATRELFVAAALTGLAQNAGEFADVELIALKAVKMADAAIEAM